MVDKNQKYRKITFYKNYFQDFFTKQNKKVKAKIVWTFDLVEDLQRVPETYLKHIENTDGLYEIRVQTGSDIFRIFCFFDQGQLVVIANGFQKKSQKTPKKEIEMALKIKAEYEREIHNLWETKKS
ncbi:MAG: type II toxin-antitoxin system RelE/ParE family toxin [Crocinitomix sp.]|nr:type II toxin-antitoxin system RelE/ParE family toxin [Crocinitomix sp.]